jgi:hypothetical protein
MKRLSLCLLMLCTCFAQTHSGVQARMEDQSPAELARKHEAMVKEDHQKNVMDADALLKLAQELKADVDKDDLHLVSVASIKKTRDIEKLAKKIRSRLQ